MKFTNIKKYRATKRSWQNTVSFFHFLFYLDLLVFDKLQGRKKFFK
ncbi:hypothetical protein HMPREF1351_00666 [Enterococcus faecium 510]|nr:hypothetical protein HMPREF1351_00666 [Enterococcus faecium 510]